MVFMGTIGSVSSFERKKYDAFYWKIDRFSHLSEKNDNYYSSPDFSFKGNKSHLNFYPNGDGMDFTGFFSVYFFSSEYRASNCVHLALGVKTKNGNIEKLLSRNYYPQEYGLGSSDLIPRSEFWKRKEDLTPEDCLTFVLFLTTDTPQLMRDFPEQTGKACKGENKKEEEKKGSEKVLSDIANLWESGDRCDAIIVVGETKFKVHSCILSARTPVFAALFKHDTLEKKTRKININDCEPAIFKEFLNHMYTGCVQNLTAKNASGLYQVADKYLVEDLKEVCRVYIQDSLSSESFCETIQLALKYGDDDLLETGFTYFAANFRVIIRSVEWQRFMKENPTEANEILVRSFGPP